MVGTLTNSQTRLELYDYYYRHCIIITRPVGNNNIVIKISHTNVTREIFWPLRRRFSLPSPCLSLSVIITYYTHVLSFDSLVLIFFFFRPILYLVTYSAGGGGVNTEFQPENENHDRHPRHPGKTYDRRPGRCQDSSIRRATSTR